MSQALGLLGWLAGRAVDAALGLHGRPQPYTRQGDIPVLMPDGVTLLGDLYQPRAGDTAQPVVLIRLPYGRAGFMGNVLAAPLARRGFQVFIQSTRGTFGSGGHLRPLTTEQQDGLTTVQWLRQQPWCDGRVAMTGGSYFGHTQWAVAPYADPPLVAVAPHVTAARFSTMLYDHGAPQLHTALSWAAQLGRQERGLPPQVPNPRHKARVRAAMDTLPLQAADVAVAGGPVPFWRDFTAHAGPGDPFWATADHDDALERMPPTSMVAGWWDLFLTQQLADFAALRAAGVDARVVIGAWMHGEPDLVKAIVQHDVPWLGHHLRGEPAPQTAPVRLLLQGTGTWLELDQWPPARSQPRAHHLRGDGALTQQPAADTQEPSRFTYDPADPTPSVGGALVEPPGKQEDNRQVEQRPDVLVFTGPSLPADLDVVGDVRAQIHVRTSLAHADVYVRVCDVDPDGRSLNVVDGIRRLQPETVPAPDVEQLAGGILAVDVQLRPTAYRFPAGHRIRVHVAGGAFPYYARNHGTGEPFATSTSGVACRFEVFHDAQHPSAVILPVLAPH